MKTFEKYLDYNKHLPVTDYKQCIFCGCDWFKVYPAEGKKICMMCGVNNA